MIALVVYDISDHGARARFHRFLKEFGLNTQKSVFECEVDETAIREIKVSASSLIDPETDSVRIYRVCGNCVQKTEISGQGIKVTDLDLMVF
jgi:CRISPR-associated protein Cas2